MWSSKHDTKLASVKTNVSKRLKRSTENKKHLSDSLRILKPRSLLAQLICMQTELLVFVEKIQLSEIL